MSILTTAGTFISNTAITVWTYLSGEYASRIVEVFKSPMVNQNMLWMLLPLLATLLLMEFYFGRYKDEELGWNTAYGNALVLVFVSLDIFRNIYSNQKLGLLQLLFSFEGYVLISVGIFCLGMILIFIDFFHFLPKKIAYIISSPAYVNLIALLGMITVYGNIPLDWTTLFAMISIFILANGLTLLLYYIIPSYKPPIQRIFTTEDFDDMRGNKKK